MSDKFQPQPEISALLQTRIDAKDFPSAVYLVAEQGEVIFADALGDAVLEPERHPATLETIYDLASLTKPLVTGLLCAQLLEANQIDLDKPVADYLSEFDRPDKRAITIRNLLTHTSGLPAWRPLYLSSDSPEGVPAALANVPLEYKPGERVMYSDLGFITLGFLVQRVTDRSLLQLARERILEPLRLQHSFFNPTEAARTGIAACESGNGYERDMCERDFHSTNQKPWRTELIWGQVHDGNAHFLGGVAGHAGLFADAEDTAMIASQFIGNQSKLLSDATCRLFAQNMTLGLNEARSFAWQLAATRDSTAGSALPATAFGHTGFTGTSCWIDPDRQRIFILLTNRTHSRALPFANINSARREFHRLAVAALAKD